MRIPQEWLTRIRDLAESKGVMVREIEHQNFAGVTLFTLNPEKYINCTLSKFESTRGEGLLNERVNAALRMIKEARKKELGK